MDIKDERIRRLEGELKELREKFDVLCFHMFGTMSKKMKTPWTFELAKSQYLKNKMNEEITVANGPREIKLD